MTLVRIIVVLCGIQLIALSLPAQTNTASATNVSASVRARFGPSFPGMIAPPGKSPVELFRELLAMNAAERKEFLTNRSLPSQKLILAKVREYESLKPDQRELRLQVTDLRWYLLPLMRIPATNRTARIERVPAEFRQLVQDRLNEWDKLPANAQKELLDNQAMIQHLTEIEGSTEEQKQRILENISPARREMLERGITEWQKLPEQQRGKMVDRFNQFFDLTSQEKEKALSRLSDAERRQLEKTLRSFGALSPQKRAQCVRSFEKFASLNLEERQQFLKNADRWKLMSPNERQAWRDLVSQMPSTPPHLVLPPRPNLPRRSPSVATNGN
jgi:hypothetical protein